MLESSPILSWMSNYIFEAAIRIVRQSMREDDPQEPLTERETECLFWASEGKTSGEIACILGITERTVNYHLNQVTCKTGSMNRYQAIAKGVSSGILLPNLSRWWSPTSPPCCSEYRPGGTGSSPGIPSVAITAVLRRPILPPILGAGL
jgi:DNA-binding CsgD family transcriptional regulator